MFLFPATEEMMRKTKKMSCLLLAAAALAPMAMAQNQGGRAQPPTSVPPVHVPPAHVPQQPHQHAAAGATKAPETRAQAEVRERARLRAQDPEAQQRWQNAMQNTMQYENTYRLQMARLERIQQIYRDQQRMDRVAQLTQLRARLEARYHDRQQDCRQAMGEEDYAQLRDRIAQHDQLHTQEQARDQTQDRVSTPSR